MSIERTHPMAGPATGAAIIVAAVAVIAVAERLAASGAAGLAAAALVVLGAMVPAGRLGARS